jgi:hypothetical protein
MILILLNSILELDEDALKASLVNALTAKFKSLLIKSRIQVVKNELLDDNCEHYIVVLVTEFDYSTKTEKEQYEERLRELVEMTLSNQYDASEFKLLEA